MSRKLLKHAEMQAAAVEGEPVIGEILNRKILKVTCYI